MKYSYKGIMPQVMENVFIAPNASIIGDVSLSSNVSVWFNAVIRADVNSIRIGKGSNIQDNAVIHVSENDDRVIIGCGVTVGHGAIIHGAIIGNDTLIGMGSIILDGAIIGDNCLIAAGTLVPQGKKIPSGVLCMGVPAEIVRKLNEKEKEKLRESGKHYEELSRDYLNFKSEE